MTRGQWIVCLFSIAVAMSLVHNILPHSHPEENTNKGNKDHSALHHHSGNDHDHSQQERSKPVLPVFTHFSNSDFIASAKFSYQEKRQMALEFELPQLISVELPILPGLPLPIPHARDLPQGFLLSIQSLRAPPYFFS